MNCVRIALASLLILVSYYGYSQQPYHISGMVVDSLSTGIPRAVVQCYSRNEIFAATTTDSEGKFSLALQADSIRLEITHIQYKTYEYLLKSAGDVDLGTIVLSENKHYLAAVRVTADFIKRRGTDYEVSVRNHPAAKNNSLLLFMNTLPGVNGLSINGRESAILFVNGRELSIPLPEQIRYLAGLRAEDVESISIMPSGGSKYRANHKGGIIRIRLQRRDDHLFSGSTSIPLAVNTHDGALSLNVPVSLNYTTPKLSSYTWLSGNYLQNEAQEHEYVIGGERERTSSSRDYYAVVFDQSVLYDIRKNHTVGLALNSMIKPGERSVTDMLTGGIAEKVSLWRGGGTLTYEWTFGEQESNIHVAADYLYHQDGYNSSYTRTGGDSEYTVSKTKKDTFSGSVDSELNFADEVSSLNLGVQYLQMNTAQRYEQYARHNRFLYDEQIYGAYSEFNTSFGDENFDLSAGLRYEATRVKWKYDETNAVLSRDADRYHNLFPSFSLTYNSPSGKNYTAIEYERSISRPLMADYNPVVQRESDNIYSVGASKLLPQFEDVISLTQSVNKNHLFVLSYTINKDLYDTVYQTVGDDLYMKYGNFGSSQKLDLYAETRFWIVKKWLHLRLSGTGAYTRFAHSVYGNSRTFDGEADGTLTLVLPKSWRVFVSGHYQTPTTTPIQCMSEFWGVNAGVRKNVGDCFVFGVSGANIFYNKGFTTKSRQAEIDFRSYTRSYFQNLTFYVTYNFGSSKLQSVKQAKTNSAVRERSNMN